MEILLKKHCNILLNNKIQNDSDINKSCFRNVNINKIPNTSYNPKPIIIDKVSTLDDNDTTVTHIINPEDFMPIPCFGRYSFDFVDIPSKIIISDNR